MSSLSKVLQILSTGTNRLGIEMSVKANNLANAGVTGYKSQYAVSSDLSYETIQGGGGPTASSTPSSKGLEIGMGTKVCEILRNFSQGSGTQTDNPYHIMIEGEGFFQVNDLNGNSFYTRAGTFQLNNQKQLVMPGTGYILQPVTTLDPNAISINIDRLGNINQQMAQGVQTPLTQIPLYTFLNNNGLQSMGDNVFMQTPLSGSATQGKPGQYNYGTLQQGWLEGSNINAMSELTDTIEITTNNSYLMKMLNHLRRSSGACTGY